IERGAAAAGVPLRVAVSVREWRHFRSHGERKLARYRAAVADAVRALVAQGAEVTFVSTCQGVDAYWTDDARFARGLVAELLPDLRGVHVDERFRDPLALRDHLRSYDLAVATRMHFAILALCAGVPVVPIAYEFKTTALFGDLGLQDLVLDIEAVTGTALRARINAALARLPDLRDHIAAALPALRSAALRPAHVIRDTLASGARAAVASARGAP
ncbi:MAG: polysaccharide pyruvyl transferase family protein, partial [Longimicrobiales bacterium]